MPTLDYQQAIFVCAAYALQPEGGGVQRCTREYLALMTAAGWQTHPVAYSTDRRLWTRLRRRLAPAPYRNIIPRSFAQTVAEAVQARGAGWVFFNQIEAAPLIPMLAPLREAGVRFALLSHGVDSSDYLHETRIRATLQNGRPISRRDAGWLGAQLFAEMEQHRYCDVVFCLSETDRQLEQWLGGKAVYVLPRTVDNTPLPWQPVAGRLGTVGTLVHAPNCEGLVLFCQALAAQPIGPIRLRLIGSPAEPGRRLAAQFPFIEYLGPLNDAEFAVEARSWCAFVNPIFCFGRGCRTKLAVPLSWRLPLATTRAGARGYVWDENLVPLVETPADLAQLARQLSDPAQAARQRRAVEVLAARSPQLADLVPVVQDALRKADGRLAAPLLRSP